MIIPIRTDYRMSRTPWVNYALVAINVIVYFLGYNAANNVAYNRVLEYVLQPDNPKLVQFASSMFLHGGFAHLFGNMIFLWVFGNAMNDRFGHAGYLAFYLAGGILAGVGYLLLSGNAPVVGASGAIAAVTGAYLVLLPRTRVTVLALLLYVLVPYEIPSLYFLAFQLVWNLALTSFNLSGDYAAGGSVAYAAHSAGYVFGIAMAAGLLAAKVMPRDAYDLLNLYSNWRRRTRYQRMVRQGYDPFSPVSSRVQNPGAKWVDPKSRQQKIPDSPEAKELDLRRGISEALGHGDLAGAAGKYLQLVQLAGKPVLALPQQLDVANYLMADEQHAAAADAYEKLLAHYGNYEHAGDIYLMLGLLYGRYLHQYARADSCLQRAIELLSDPRKLELARGDLDNLRRSGKI